MQKRNNSKILFFAVIMIAIITAILLFAFYNPALLSPDDEQREEIPEQNIASWPENQLSLPIGDTEPLEEASVDPSLVVNEEEFVNPLQLPQGPISPQMAELSQQQEQEKQQLMGREPFDNKWILVLSNIGGALPSQQGFPDYTPEQVAQIHQQIKSIAGDSFSGSVTKVLNAIFLNDPDPQTLKQIVEYAQSQYPEATLYPDGRVYLQLMDSVPLINAPSLWNSGYTGEGVSIAVIDTGVDYTHADLGNCVTFQTCPKFLGGYDFINEDNDPLDDQGHGTHVAATAAGDGTLKGVAPGAKLYAYKIFDSHGKGGYDSRIIAAIERSIDPNEDGNYEDHADVLSMSVGSYGSPLGPVASAVNNANDIGSVVVVAAGNNWYGAKYGDVQGIASAAKAVTVGASDKQDEIGYFSMRGPVLYEDKLIVKPEVLAPGVDICAGTIDNSYYYWVPLCNIDPLRIKLMGTSMATPHVSGAAALLLQAHPTWKPHEVKSALIQGARDIGYDIYTQGGGRIDVLNSTNQQVLVSPNPVNLKIYKATDTSVSFSINVTNIYSSPQGIRITDLSLHNIDANSHTTQVQGIEICINPSSTQVLPLNLDLSLLSLGKYSGVINISVYDDCTFNTEPSPVRVPMGFAKLYYLNVTFIGTPATPQGYYLYHNNLFALVNQNNNATNYRFFDYGQQHTRNYDIYSIDPEVDFLSIMVEHGFHPTYNKLNTDYFIDHVDLTTTDHLTLNVLNTQSVQQNITDIIQSKSLSMRGFKAEFIQKNNYASILPYIFYVNNGPFDSFKMGVYANNIASLFNNDYLFHFSPHARDHSNRSLVNNSMILPIAINYPFTDLNKIISPADVHNISLRIPSSLKTYFDQNVYFGIGSYSPFNYWSDAAVTKIALPKNGLFYYLKGCEECYYHFKTYVFDAASGNNAYILSNYFNGKAKYIPETINDSLSPISFYEESLRLSLSNNHCAVSWPGFSYYCEDKVLRGFFNDRFNAESHIMTQDTSGNFVISTPTGQSYSIFSTNNAILPFGRIGSFIIDCTQIGLSWPSSLYNSAFCQTGIYKLAWKMPNVANKGTLQMFSAVQYDSNGFTIKSLSGIETALEIYYKFNNISSLGLAPDFSLYSRHGASNGVDLVKSTLGNVFRFGQGDYVTTKTDIDLENEFTVSGWINLDKLTSETGQATMRIIDKSLAGQDWPSYMLLVNNQDRLAFSFRPQNTQSNPQIVAVQAPLEKNKWYFVTATLNNGTLKMYVNGNLKASSNVGNLIPYDNNHPVFVGAANGTAQTGGPRESFHGSMHHVRIHSRALNSEEVMWLYKSG